MFFRLLIVLMPIQVLAQEPSLIEFLQKAWEKSPVLKGEALQNEASDQFIKAARGKYLPHVSIDAIDTTGFPASNSDLRVSGLMGSPFRSGVAGGLTVEQTVYDFGRIEAAMRQAKAERSLAQARLAEDKYRFLFSLGLVYLSCARTRSLQRIDSELMSWAKINLKETARFTKTGQRSIIDNSLVQTEVNALQLELDQLRKYEVSLNEQMKLYGTGSGCKRLSESLSVEVPTALKVEEPSLLLAKAQIESSQASYAEAKSAQLPKIHVTGSIGDMDRARLVNQQDYSAGIGLVFPIWNGGEDARREEALKTVADSQGENLKAAQLEFSARIKDLEDQLARDRDALTVLEKNLGQVQSTIRLASKRYQTLEGPLVDVREAFKQLRSIGLDRLRVLETLARTSLQLGMLQANERI